MAIVEASNSIFKCVGCDQHYCSNCEDGAEDQCALCHTGPRCNDCAFDHATSHETESEATLTLDDIHEFNGYLATCTDAQVRGVYAKEMGRGGNGPAFAELAKAEARKRGIGIR